MADPQSTEQIADTVTAILARAPQWLRQDLIASDAAARARAEETLSAMIADALDTEDVAAK